MQKKVLRISIMNTLVSLNVGEQVEFKVTGRDRDGSYNSVKNAACRLKEFKYTTHLSDYGQSVIVTRLK